MVVPDGGVGEGVGVIGQPPPELVTAPHVTVDVATGIPQTPPGHTGVGVVPVVPPPPTTASALCELESTTPNTNPDCIPFWTNHTPMTIKATREEYITASIRCLLGCSIIIIYGCIVT